MVSRRDGGSAMLRLYVRGLVGWLVLVRVVVVVKWVIGSLGWW